LSRRAIQQKLREKGFKGDVIETEIEGLTVQLNGSNVDLVAAVRYLKKRRFGCFSKRTLDHDARRKHLAALGRRGFSYGLSREALEMDRDAADTLLYQNESAL